MEKPFLVGVRHNPRNLDATLRLLLSLGVKKIGLEVSARECTLNPLVASSEYGRNSSHFYWSLLAAELREKGITVVPLLSDSIARERNERFLRFGQTLHDSSSAALSNPDAIFFHHTYTKEIEQQALETKAEAIVSGTFHSLLLRKDLQIPKKKFFWIKDGPPTRWEKILHKLRIRRIEPEKEMIERLMKKIRATRRYQHRFRKSP